MVSIIIPVYNASKFLVKCLDSCFAQSYADIEVVAINDGSTDECPDILDTYSRKEPRLKVFHQKNRGVVAAREAGINKSIGDWLMFVDADDFITENAVQVLLEAVTLYMADMAVANYKEWFPDKNIERVYSFPSWNLMTGVELINRILSQKMNWGLCCKLYKKELFGNTVSVPFKLGEDASLFVQVALKAQTIALRNEVIYTYLQHPASAVHREASQMTADIYRFRVWIADYLIQSGYGNRILLNKFIVTGYIECLFQGGKPYLTDKEYLDVSFLYSTVNSQLAVWRRLIFLTFKNRRLNKWIISGCKLFQKFKFQLLQIKK